MKKLSAITAALLCVLAASARVTLPQLFAPGMVLQRNQPIAVWGQADAGEAVTVVFRKKTYSATAAADGSWRVTLPQQKAGGPYTLEVRGSSSSDVVTIGDVLVGDVWLCSGQSNIDVTVERVYPQYGKVIDDYENAQIRMFRVLTDFDTHGPRRDIKPTGTNWKPVTRQNAWNFSAVGYFLGREMFQKTGVPQGIIVNSLGGSPIQAWLAADTLKTRWPEQYARTLFFQDDAMVASMQSANRAAQNRWQQLLDSADPGLTAGYAARSFDDSAWSRQQVFQTVGGRQQSRNLTRSPRYHGTLWVRQHVTVDAAHAGQPARLLVGTLFDADQTFVNGREVGRTFYQYPPRRYTVPAGLLTAGDNVLAVRFTTKGGSPHFIPEKPYKLIFDDGTEVPLSDEWLVGDGCQLPSCPSIDTGGQNLPSVLYNAMLCPLAPYTMQGVVWYQGESNTGDGNVYAQYLTQLISGWRQLFQQPALPFVVVQLANFQNPSAQPQNSGWAAVREAQRLVAESVPDTRLAVALDLGETVDIHPLRKQEVAQRVARAFDQMLWNKKLLLSPRVVAVKTVAVAAGGKPTIELTLDQPLDADGPLNEFEVAGQGGRYQNAVAEGRGNIITVQSPVDRPVSIRYAWKDNPLTANVRSKDGLPMSSMQIAVE